MGLSPPTQTLPILNDVGFSSHAVRVIFFLGKITRRYNKNPSPTLPFEKKGSSPPFKKGGVRGGFPKKVVLFQNQWIKITFLKQNDFHTDLIFCLRSIFTKLYEVIERLSNKCP
jgi:hypothetical protein